MLSLNKEKFIFRFSLEVLPKPDGAFVFDIPDRSWLGSKCATYEWDVNVNGRWNRTHDYWDIPKAFDTTQRDSRLGNTVFCRWLYFAVATYPNYTNYHLEGVRVLVLRDNLGGELPPQLNDMSVWNLSGLRVGNNGAGWARFTEPIEDLLYPRFTVLADRCIRGQDNTWAFGTQSREARSCINHAMLIPLGFPMNFKADVPNSRADMGSGNIIVMVYAMCGDKGTSTLWSQGVIYTSYKLYFDDTAPGSSASIQETIPYKYNAVS